MIIFQFVLMELIKKELKSWSETLRIDNVPKAPTGGYGCTHVLWKGKLKTFWLLKLKLLLKNIKLKKSKGAHEPKAQTAGASPGFLSMKHAKEYCYCPLDGMLVHRGVTPQQYAAGTHLYTWVKRDKVASKPGIFLSKETTRRVRLEPWTSRSGVRGVNRTITHASTEIIKLIVNLVWL